MNTRKNSTQRAFSGLAGSPLALVSAQPAPESQKKKRGRPPKYENDEQRKSADATRKRGERVVAVAQEVIRAHPDHLGSHGESSGGHSPQQMDKIVGAQQAAEAVGLGHNRDVDKPELTTPDRRRVSYVPAHPDDAKDNEKESDSTFINNALRRQAASLRQWINSGSKKKKFVCSQDHKALAERHKNSVEKVYCRRCRKLLVKPGIFSDAVQEVQKASIL